MLDEIRKCKKCRLFLNQQPLLDKKKSCDIIWVGLSAKKVDDIDSDFPLSPNTNTGSILFDIEKNYQSINTYRTNIVKCLPLDENGKLRYPSNHEMVCCLNNFHLEIKTLKPKIVFLLGSKVLKIVSQGLNTHLNSYTKYNYSGTLVGRTLYVPIQHPSYIYIYKRKYIQSYTDGVMKVIDSCL